MDYIFYFFYGFLGYFVEYEYYVLCFVFEINYVIYVLKKMYVLMFSYMI